MIAGLQGLAVQLTERDQRQQGQRSWPHVATVSWLLWSFFVLLLCN